MKRLLSLFFVLAVTLFIYSCAEAEVNLDLTIGRSQYETVNNYDFNQPQMYPQETRNQLNGISWSVGASGHVWESEYFGLLVKGSWTNLGRFRGRMNKVCAPEGCASGAVPVEFNAWMDTYGGTQGITFGMLPEVKWRSFFLHGEAGLFYGQTFLKSWIHIPGKSTRMIQESNEVLSYYYGGRVGYKTDYGSVYLGARWFPAIGGPQQMCDTSVSYEIGILIPVWR